MHESRARYLIRFVVISADSPVVQRIPKSFPPTGSGHPVWQVIAPQGATTKRAESVGEVTHYFLHDEA